MLYDRVPLSLSSVPHKYTHVRKHIRAHIRTYTYFLLYVQMKPCEAPSQFHVRDYNDAVQFTIHQQHAVSVRTQTKSI